MIKWKDVRMEEWMSEWKNELMNEWKDVRMLEWKNEWVSEWWKMNERIIVRMNEMNEWIAVYLV